MAEKKGGLLGGFTTWASKEFMESDEAPAKPAVAASTKPTPAPVAAPAYTAPAYSMSPQAASAPFSMSAAPVAPVGVADADSMAAVNDGVFGGGATAFTRFMKVRESMGNPADPNVVIGAMKAMDDTVSAAAITTALAQHLKRLDDVKVKAAGDFDAATQSQIGGADREIERLQGLNETAKTEIERNQRETTERLGQMGQINAQKVEDQGKITRARLNVEAAEAVVQGQLEGMQRMLQAVAPAA